MKHLFFLIAFSLPLANARAEVKSPKAIVEEIFQKSAAEGIATDVSKQAEVNALVDFDALARAVLVKQKASAEDFAWFRDTLKEIITRTVYPKAPEFLKGTKITFNADDVKGQRATVKSTVQNKADLTDVDYELANVALKKIGMIMNTFA